MDLGLRSIVPSKPLKAINAMFPAPSSWRIVRGDIVQVMAGKDKGRQGEVVRVVRDQRFPRLFVKDINMITRRITKRTLMSGEKQPGFNVRMEAPLHYSNVMLVDPLSKKPVRTYFMYEDQPPYKRVRKTRGKHATDSVIPWPQKWKDDLSSFAQAGDKDTPLDVVQEVTYNPEVDFNMQLPTAHRQIRRVNEARAAAAAAAEKKAMQQQQRWQKSKPLLLGGRGAADAAAGSEQGSSMGGAAAGSNVRSYSSSCCDAASSIAGGASSTARSAAGSLLMLQRSMLSHSSRSGFSACAGLQQQQQRLSWCGLAASPLLW